MVHVRLKLSLNASHGIRTRVATVRGSHDWPDYTSEAYLCLDGILFYAAEASIKRSLTTVYKLFPTK